MKIKPIRDQVFYEIVEIPWLTKPENSLIYRPSTEKQEGPKPVQFGRVLAVGDGELFQDPTKAMNLKQLEIGCIIVLNQFAGIQMESLDKTKTLSMCSYGDVLGIWEDFEECLKKIEVK